MAKRASLAGNVAKAKDAGQAAEVARKLAGKAPQDHASAPVGESETVSYNLPLELIDEVAELANLRLHFEKLERRKAKAEGINRGTRPQARRSASAIIREALYAHRGAIQAEIADLTARKG